MSQRKYRAWNFSSDSDYHSQRNNMLIPLESCNTTAMVMALKQAGHSPDPGEYFQPEDRLTAFLQSAEAYDEMRNQAPWAFNRTTGKAIYKPNEVHVLLSWAVNEILHDAVSIFKTDWSQREIIHLLLNGGGVVLSGRFPLEGDKYLDHVVSLAGFILDEPASKSELLEDHEVEWRIEHWIIDDPYGDWHSGYMNHRGNNIQITAEELNWIVKPENSREKWAHLISPVYTG